MDTYVQVVYVARFAIKIGYQKDTCDDEVGLCAQSSYTILGPILNTIGRVCGLDD